jgi:hypothetical protein
MLTPNLSMLLVKNSWNEKESFKLIPVSTEAPYAECIYDPESKVLVVIAKITKKALHMIPKLDGDGYPSTIQKGANAGKPKQERAEIDVFYEYYIEDTTDIEAIINLLAVNNKEFDWKKFVVVEEVTKKEEKKSK